MLEIKAKADKTAEVYIYDDIGEGWLGGISAKHFADEIKKLGAMNTINVRINSGGGSVFDGTAMYNTLVRNSARVVVDVDGLAASIASIIAMAGDEIRMASNAFMMIHDPWIVAGGSAEDLRKQADLLDKARDVLIDTYVAQTGQDNDKVSELMHAETWMTADEARELGFIHSISDELDMAASIDTSKHKYRNVPAALLHSTPKKEFSSRATVNSSLRLMRAKVRAIQLTASSRR